ncbi:MAG: 1,4-alpha-glucan branching enzyme, partial [Glaciecola sp.]
MTKRPGELALVLHTHLPWLKNHGQWPVGEEWLFQAWGTSWLAVTDLLWRLGEEGHRDVLTLGVTPMVAAQVDDERLRDEMGSWLAGGMWRSWEQGHHHWMGEEVTALDSHHWKRFANLLRIHTWVEEQGGLLAVWADLDRRGVIEILGGPATHPYQPLLDDQAVLAAQLEIGLRDHERWLGHRPTGIWAPECGYRPAGPVGDPAQEPVSLDDQGTPSLHPREGAGPLPGLEELYAAAGITHTMMDAATLVRAAGGADRDWTTRPDVPDPAAQDPYEVVHDGVLVGASQVTAFARDLSVAYHVWSPDAGYPGGDWYLDFHSPGTFGTHPSWRVTSKTTPPGAKAIYEPEQAAAAVALDAAHFVGELRSVLDPRPGDLVVAAYDTELFGHWWYEGAAWLEGVLRRVLDDPALRTTTLRSRRDRRPATRRLALPESSWGYAKGHATWVTSETRPLWQRLQDVQDRAMAVLDAEAGPLAIREQIARELLQAQCSDWPFLITRGNSPEYAWGRFTTHADNVDQLCEGLQRAPDSHALATLAEGLRTTNSAPADVAALTTRRIPSVGPVPVGPSLTAPAATQPSVAPPCATQTHADQSLATDRRRPVRRRTSADPSKGPDHMRILLLSWEYPPRVVGGLGRHVAALSRALAAQGHEVHVVTRDHPGAPAQEWTSDGIHVVRVAEAPPFIPFSDLISWVLAFNNGVQAAAQRILTEYEIDVVH